MKPERKLNSIIVYNHNLRSNIVDLYTNVECLLGKHVIVRKELNEILISFPTIDYRGKVYKFSKAKNTATCSVNLDIEKGKYILSEEDSTEDRLIFIKEENNGMGSRR